MTIRETQRHDIRRQIKKCSLWDAVLGMSLTGLYSFYVLGELGTVKNETSPFGNVPLDLLYNSLEIQKQSEWPVNQV